MASYTVVIVPLRNSPTSLDALRFFLWVKKLKDLERQKDLLWMGLQALEQVRETLCLNLEEKMQARDTSSKKIEMRNVFPDSLLLSQIHRVNKTLSKLLCDYRNHTDPGIEGSKGNQPSPACSEESACF